MQEACKQGLEQWHRNNPYQHGCVQLAQNQAPPGQCHNP